MKPKMAEGTCLCGGRIFVTADEACIDEPVIAHTFPTCADYERLDTVADAADFLERVNAAHAN